MDRVNTGSRRAITEVPRVAERLTLRVSRTAPAEADRNPRCPGVRSSSVGHWWQWCCSDSGLSCGRARQVACIRDSQRNRIGPSRRVSMDRVNTGSRRAITEVPRVAERLTLRVSRTAPAKADRNLRCPGVRIVQRWPLVAVVLQR